MNKLFIFTHLYPFGDGESYFEDEIKFLTKQFEDITIFSIAASKKDEPTRSVPLGVKVIPLNCKKKHIVNTIKGLFIIDKRYKTKFYGFKKWLIYKYLLGRKKSIFNATMKTFYKANNLSEDNVLLYSYWLSFAGACSDICEKLNRRGIKTNVISRAHGYDLFWERMPLCYAPLQKTTINRINHVYSVSKTGSEYLINKYPELSNKISFERLGTFDNGYVESSLDNDCLFATCSNNRAVKRLPLFAEAFNKLIKTNKNNHWHAIGLSGKEDSIIQKLDNSDSFSHITFYGVVPSFDVVDIYKNRHINYLINVSSSEGLPVSIMEAMSLGIPVIATDVGGTNELVDDSCGRLVGKDICPDELANILVEMSSIGDEKYQLLKKNARAKWQRVANANVNYEKWCNILKGYFG